MKIKKNFPIKFFAFLLAILCLAGCAVMACFQLTEIGVLWGNESSTSSRHIHRMMAEEFGDIYYMISLQQTSDRNALQEEQLQALEERFSAENTNLRWQIRDSRDTLLHGNTEGEMPAAAFNGYWFYFTMGDHAGVITTSGDWQSHVDGLYTAEELPAQVRTEGWLPALAEAVERWEAGDHTADPDAVYLSESNNTDLLIIDVPTGMTVYAPTIRSVLEVNKHGYQYSLSLGKWIRRISSKEHHIVMWMDENLSVDDEYKAAVLAVQSWHTNRVLLLIVTAALALVWLILTVCLCAWSGWRKGHEEISLCWFHRIPGDLLLACYIFLAALLAVTFADSSYSIWGQSQNAIPLWGQLALAGLFGGGAAILLTSFLITLCARCKGRVVLRNMIVVRVLVGFWHAVRAAVEGLPLVWKAAVGGFAYLGISFLLWVATLNNGGAGWVLLWAILSLLAVFYLLWWAFQWKLLRRGAREIIGGNASYHIENRSMPHDLKGHADDLNRLGETITAAVEDRMRSEHFKAELITNVSHDLKTPLTSIISYVDLLKKEDIDNPRAAEYIEVLDRKSQRLKKLTEDLVEASKASTGNLTVTAERLDLVQLVDQALAEYQEKLESQRLSIVRTLPAEPVWVRADGRHLWRVVDNLLSNCAKYSLEGTRVYAEVESFADCAELRIKNISREALNVDPDTLMERFVRGDESRTTEGSGLGLSIAQSLTDLQAGSFHIAIDGDLFKATVRLPLAE